MVCPFAGTEMKMKSDHPARLLSLRQIELFTNFFETKKSITIQRRKPCLKTVNEIWLKTILDQELKGL